MELLNSLIHELDDGYLVLIMTIGIIAYLIKNSGVQVKLYEFKDKVKAKYKKELRNFIRAQMDMVVITSVNKATDIIDNMESPCKGQLCGVNPLDQQLGIYEARLKVTVKTYLTDAIYICLYENGFGHMSETERDIYYRATSLHLRLEVDTAMNVYKRNYRDIMQSEELRFSVDQAYNMYKDIVQKFLRLKELEKAEIKQYKEDHKLWSKIKGWVK